MIQQKTIIQKDGITDFYTFFREVWFHLFCVPYYSYLLNKIRFLTQFTLYSHIFVIIEVTNIERF